MKNLKWHNIRLIVILLVMLFLYSFASKRNNERIISKIEIQFESNENLFLTPEMVNNFLVQKLKINTNIKKNKLILDAIEKALDKHEMIEKAHVFSTIDGVLNTRIVQKTPIIRVISEKGSYYLDSKGDKMSLSNNFSARVPLLFGEIPTENQKPYLFLFNEIKKDDFLSKNITGAKILTSGQLILTTRSFNYNITFGKPIEIDKKLKNYKAFYQFAIKDTLIRSYKEVNLIFTEQVVCKK
jgi:cell division protein FtsQ